MSRAASTVCLSLLLVVSASVSATAQTTEWLDADAPAPPCYAPAFGFDAGDGLTLDVRPESGASTLFEIDLADHGLALRRARGSGQPALGLFGQGWVSDLDARVTPLAGGFAVRRLQGMSLFVPLQDDVFVSLWGDVELLRRSKSGFELASASGRVLRFDEAGVLTALAPEFTVTRTPGSIQLAGAEASWTLHLDGEGRVVQVDAGEAQLRYRYEDGELASVRGARSRDYTVRGGRVARIAEGDQELLRLDYDRRGRLSTLDAGKWRQTYRYEVRGRRRGASVQTPEGAWTYRLLGRGWLVDTPLGREYVRFDRRGRVVKSGGPGAVDPWPTSLPGGPVEREHDAAGRVTVVRGPGVRETLAWDAAGRLRSRTSVDRRTTRYAYDDAGRLTRDVAPAGTTAYRYDSAGRVRRVETPAGVAWSFRYAQGALSSQDGPAGEVTFERQGGRLVRREDASGVSLDYAYDVFGRPVEVADAKGRSVRFGYDRSGRLSSWSGALGVTRVREDGATRTVTQTGPRGPITLRTTRVANGEVIATPFGGVERRRDARGRVTRLDSPAGTFRFDYDASGRRRRLVYPNGVRVRTDRDALGRATERRATRAGRILDSVETVWNARHEVARRRTQAGVSTYTYDAAGRLASADTPRGLRRYGYDGDGNRTSEARGEEARQSSYDAKGRLRSRGPERFRHDAAGRLIERRHARGIDRFGYDGFGRLAWVQRAGAPRVSYGYDALGRVVARRVGDAVSRFVYEGTRLLAELGPGARERVFVYGPELDEPLAYSEGGRWTYLLSSELHATRAYVDASGEVVSRAEVGAFGEVLAADLGRPLFFAGRLYDPIARLYPMRARVYDPDLGRFLSPDPSGLAGGVNAYTYARNRPLDRADPLGLWDWVPDWAQRAAASISETSASVASGAQSFLAHTAGFAEYMWEDVKAGRARDRVYGAVDAYSSFMTFGLLGTNLSEYAGDAAEAKRGEVYGEAAGWAFALISGRQLLVSGAKGLYRGALALPQAPSMIINGARSLRASGPTWLPRAGAALANAPGAAVQGLRWLNANRGPLGASLLAFLKTQGAGVWNVTGRPFVSAGEAGVDLLRGLISSAKAAAPAAKTASAAKSAAAVGQGARAAGQGADVAMTSAKEASRLEVGSSRGAAGSLRGEPGGKASRWTTARARHTHKPPGAPAGFVSVHPQPPGWLTERIERTVAAVKSGEAGPAANAEDVRRFLHETYEHADEVTALTRALGGSSRSIPVAGSGRGPLRGIHDFGERASLRRVKGFLEAVKKEPLKDPRSGEVVPVPQWLDDLVAEGEAASKSTVDVGKLSPDVAAGLGRTGPPDPYAIRLHNLSAHHTRRWSPHAGPNDKAVIESVADQISAMRQPRAYRRPPMPMTFEEIREHLLGAVARGELPRGSERLIDRALKVQARLERTPGSGVNPYYLWGDAAPARTGGQPAAAATALEPKPVRATPETALVDEVEFAALSPEDQALIRGLEKRLDDEALEYMHVDDGLGIRNNGSGESAASIEALNRARENRFLIVDRRGNVVRELTGPDSVDFDAARHLLPGQAYVIQNRSTGAVTVWDVKGVSAEAIRANTKTTLANAAKPAEALVEVPTPTIKRGFEGEFVATWPSESMASIRFSQPRPGVVEVTDLFTLKAFGKGSGPTALAKSIKAAGVQPPSTIRIAGIINQPTVDALEAGAAAKATVLGRTISRTADVYGARITAWRHGLDRRGKPWIEADLAH